MSTAMFEEQSVEKRSVSNRVETEILKNTRRKNKFCVHF